LILIEQAELLARLHNRVLIPPAVVWEFESPETPDVIRRWVSTRPEWAEVIAPVGEPDRIQPGAGEREAIRLAREYDAVLLCDDRRAVSRGRREGLLVTGTLGVLEQARANGWIEIEQKIKRLQERTTMYLPKRHALEQIIEEASQLRTRNPTETPPAGSQRP
jgi:uncharacterized protein